MQIIQMILLVIVLLFGAMFIAFKSPKLKMKEILDDVSVGLKMREDIINEMLLKVQGVSSDDYESLKEEMKVFDEYKKANTSLEKVIFDEKMEKVVGEFLLLSNKYEALADDFRFVELTINLKGLETRIINTKFRYNGFIMKYNKRRETALGKIFANIYRFNKLEGIYISNSIKDILTGDVK